MKREFIPYEQALELKELGFNEKCFAAMDMYSNIDYGSEMYDWINNLLGQHYHYINKHLDGLERSITSNIQLVSRTYVYITFL